MHSLIYSLIQQIFTESYYVPAIEIHSKRYTIPDLIEQGVWDRGEARRGRDKIETRKIS